MAEEIGFENGKNSNFQGLLTLTLDPAIRHTVVHHSSTSTYIPNFIQIKETFCGRTDGHFYPSNIIRSTFGSRPNKEGWSGQQLLCFWQSCASVSRGSYVGNACGRPRASVDLPAEVSMSPNRTTKWIVYKSGTSKVLSAVEAGSVARLQSNDQSNLCKKAHLACVPFPSF